MVTNGIIHLPVVLLCHLVQHKEYSLHDEWNRNTPGLSRNGYQCNDDV